MHSESLFADAKHYIPGGVNSPVRAFKNIDETPRFLKRAYGCKLIDADDKELIDYVCSWGTALLGHADPDVCEALSETARLGLSFGAPTARETSLAKMIVDAVPSVEKVRFVSSGTEACMTAIRLARGYTKRDKIITFRGHYHGHSDSLLVAGGSGMATHNLPGSAGVPASHVADTITLDFNDIEGLENVFKTYGRKIAAVIGEPMMGNGGFIAPINGFWEKVTELTKNNGALFILDEVMTGFRVAWGGYQVPANLDPDLTTFGKVIGGGMPLAALCGKATIMDYLAPEGPVYQAGTLSGNPVAVSCGLATLQKLAKMDKPYDQLQSLSTSISQGLQSIAADHRVALQTSAKGGMFGFFFAEKKIRNFAEARANTNMEQYLTFFKGMLHAGIYLPPSAFEACFISTCHTSEEIDKTLLTADRVLKQCRA